MKLYKLSFSTLIFIFLVSALIGGFTWTYTLNTWLAFLGKESTIVFWQGMLLGILPVFGQCSIPIAVITWILFLFV